MRRIDLAGRRFGALVALEPVSGDERRNGKPSWRCHCDCGRDCVVIGDNLRRGLVTSCGCRAGAAAKRRGTPGKITGPDLTELTFGELTGVCRLGRDMWLWRCSCGAEKAIRASLVRAGDVVSCGHVLRETARKKVVEDNILGHVDGTSLSVINGIVRGKIRNSNTSGANGVRVRKYPNGRVVYQARIMFQGRERHIGTFATLEEAMAARKEAEADLFIPELEKHKNKRPPH